MMIKDRFGRVHDNLRISVTDRCNIRCFYCMPVSNIQFMPRNELLTFEELVRFVKAVIPLGVKKLRLTGGEPLVRQDLPILIEQLIHLEGIEDLSLTTNGVLLRDNAKDLFDAGLRRINISLDALNAAVFREVTRRDVFDQVMRGIQTARTTGFHPIKINAVSMKGITEQEVVPFAKLARETGMEVRFIEYMPLDADNAWERDKVLFASEIRDIISSEFGELTALEENSPHAPATLFTFADGVGKIGFIPSVSEPFCGNCNRFRLTSDGKLRNCLFSLEETDVKSLLRAEHVDDEAIRQAVLTCVAAKEAGHQINSPDFLQPNRPMYSIGG